MASMPELGSKISLISKSDIRYEGQLYTVDPNECTIALANVRSYGTEDRQGQFAIPPQEEIFDYILFRGSDIKDIRVVNNVPRVPHDPAIMQMHVSAQSQPNFQPQFSMPVMPHVGGQVGPFEGSNNQPGPFSSISTPNAQGGQLPQGTPGLPFNQQQPSQQQQTPQQQSNGGQSQQQQQNNQQPQQKNSVLDLIGGSRSTTPVSLNSRKSPTAEMGVQVNQKDGTRRNNNRGPQGGRLDSQGSHENRNQQRNNQYQGNNNQNRGGNWGNRNNNQNLRNNQRPQRRPGLHPQTFRQNQNSKGRPKTTIKFESDFDFEQANTKFEEMRLSLAKLKVGEEAKPEQVNGEAEKKDDSGNETGAGEQEQEEDDVTVGYDKTKSFFDNISCEAATDRKGKNRTDWRLERKLNSETFGVSSARRGGFYNYNRGRPGGNNGNYFNNRNNGYRNNGYNGNNGGYRGNFRNTRNYNNQRNQNQGNNQQENNPTTSLPQEKQTPTQQSQPVTVQAPAVSAGGK
ncbi:protein LSM14 homolog A-like isoform X2 [Contarinia nasturtii]|uniref:protein LSM14 homolog A-like isoform X2 n=1 Tax=Contarinia nasturtii TaxID=265458 RepID=UPI0012D4AA52|nr:protein LSM14 homolog A-like isoform X2 [Contarinia nasturtii]